jgi:hypothetical protein
VKSLGHAEEEAGAVGNPGGLFQAPLDGHRGREPHEFVDELVDGALTDVEGEQFLGVLAIEA